jgi:hypothetical protein
MQGGLPVYDLQDGRKERTRIELNFSLLVTGLFA